MLYITTALPKNEPISDQTVRIYTQSQTELSKSMPICRPNCQNLYPIFRPNCQNLLISDQTVKIYTQFQTKLSKSLRTFLIFMEKSPNLVTYLLENKDMEKYFPIVDGIIGCHGNTVFNAIFGEILLFLSICFKYQPNILNN